MTEFRKPLLSNVGRFALFFSATMTDRVKLGGWAKPGRRIGGRPPAGNVALRVELAC
jgi:hypothetical protein